jgi:ArsR family transcriptional regulator
MTKSEVSHQLALLRTARLIKKRKVGKEVYYSLADEHVKVLIEAAFEHVNEK